MTLSLLGPVFAIFRPLAAFVTGILGGTLVDVFNRDKNNAESPQPECKDECCAESNKKNKIIKGLKYGFVTLPRDIGKAMLVGLIIAAFISALVPDGYFAEKLGTGIFAMVVMMFLGIPVYVCATASVPVAAALILKGLPNTRRSAGFSDDRPGHKRRLVHNYLESFRQGNSNYISGYGGGLRIVGWCPARLYCRRYRH